MPSDQAGSDCPYKVPPSPEMAAILASLEAKWRAPKKAKRAKPSGKKPTFRGGVSPAPDDMKTTTQREPMCPRDNKDQPIEL